MDGVELYFLINNLLDDKAWILMPIPIVTSVLTTMHDLAYALEPLALTSMSINRH